MKTIQDIGFYKEDPNAPLETAANIDVADYEQSIHSGRYKTVPLSGIQVIGELNKLIKKHIPKHSGNMGGIYVYRDHVSYPGMLKRDIRPDTPISAMSFDRIIGTVDLIKTPDYSATMAIKYEMDNFVEIAIGTNVRICQNYNIFGGNSIIRTNKRDKIDLEKLLEFAENCIRGVESKLTYDLSVIHALASAEVERSRQKEIIGDLLWRSRNGNDAVIQQTDLTAAIDRYIVKPPATAWDMLQGITEVVKFGNSSGNATLQHLNQVCNYFTHQFVEDEIKGVMVENVELA